jgi:hypothetical protein
VALNSAWARETGRSPNRRFKFEKSRQLFIRSRNEPLSVVAMRVCNPDRVRPLESIAETRPKLQPAALSLSAMISQDFIRKPILPFCSLHGDDRVIETYEHKGDFKDW